MTRDDLEERATSRQGPAARPLLPPAARPPAAVALAVCAAVTALLGAIYAGRSRAGWLDATVDARVEAMLGWHPAFTGLVLKPIIGRTLGGYLSFPSGHTTGVFAVAAMIGMGAHYFTDTVGGVMVAVGVVLATALAVDKLAAAGDQRKSVSEPISSAESSSLRRVWR